MCGSEQFTVLLEEPPYSVRRCGGCRLVRVSPRLDQDGLAAIYASEAYWRSASPKTVGYGDYRNDEPLYLKTFRRRLGFALRSGPHGGKALDVGCAAGFCMKVLSDMGFDVYGVEPSHAIARHAEERFGFGTVHVGTIETCQHPPDTFDLITMWDVVEHVVDPRALLTKARELLKPGGVLVLETQNIDSAFARLLGRRWHHYKHSEHIYHFTPETVGALLTSIGFEIETLTPRFAGKYVSFDFVAERAGRVHPALTTALRPLTMLSGAGFYVNVMDEIMVRARLTAAHADSRSRLEVSTA
jgi:2-polyprenyl-3-methyl-5-hydroxy-6-metoxy-1,4-benzoquinol methylase